MGLPVVGLEPTRPCGQQILSLSRLPVPTHRQMSRKFYQICFLMSIAPDYKLLKVFFECTEYLYFDRITLIDTIYCGQVVSNELS